MESESLLLQHTGMHKSNLVSLWLIQRYIQYTVKKQQGHGAKRAKTETPEDHIKADGAGMHSAETENERER